MGTYKVNVVRKFIYRVNMNLLISIPMYSLFYLMAFYLFTDKSNLFWIFATRSLMLGTFSGLFFRFVVYGEGYDRKKRIKFLMWIIICVLIVFSILEIFIKKIT